MILEIPIEFSYSSIWTVKVPLWISNEIGQNWFSLGITWDILFLTLSLKSVIKIDALN